MDPKTVRDWLAAKKVIKEFLRDLGIAGNDDVVDLNSEALIARLVNANLLIVHKDRVKE